MSEPQFRRSAVATLRFALTLALVFAAGPALAYTVIFKDGSQLLAKSKYEVRGAQAIITLPSGTRTAFPLDEIDAERTAKANEQDLGTAILIEDGKAQNLTKPPVQREQRIGDLIQSGRAGMNEQTPTAPAGGAAPAVARPKGFDENAGANRPAFAPYRDNALVGEIKSLVASTGLPVEVAQGSGPRRPLLVYETESEGMVFRALLATASALVETRKKSSAVDSFEMVCSSPDGSPAARFTLDPTEAADLLAGRTEISRFFVDQVEF